MAKVIIGRKLGMTQFFTEDGGRIPVTVIQAGPCPVAQVKSAADHGYDAIQLAYEAVPERKISKPERGHLGKNGIEPHRHLHEFRGAFELTTGEVVTVEGFEPGDAIKVSGRSKGKGFAGTIKRHGFSRGPVSHGSHNVRAPGSIGAAAYPARVFKGIRGPGQMGNKRVTQKGLEVVRVDVDNNLLLVRGSVPGPRNGVVEVRTDG
jgi:large subunit ribosomal protein L3